MGRDLMTGSQMLEQIVSTHAPAWGATPGPRRSGEVEGVSTHAPAWGATAANPLCERHLKVSTHAPAWGATTNNGRLASA